MNEHEEIIRNTIFHTYPFNRLGFSPDEPHADDCPGCIVEAEVKKLVTKLDALSDVDKIIAELEDEKKKRKALDLDRSNAFRKARVGEKGPVTDLVEKLIDDYTRLEERLQLIQLEVNHITKIIESRN